MNLIQDTFFQKINPKNMYNVLINLTDEALIFFAISLFCATFLLIYYETTCYLYFQNINQTYLKEIDNLNKIKEAIDNDSDKDSDENKSKLKEYNNTLNNVNKYYYNKVVRNRSVKYPLIIYSIQYLYCARHLFNLFKLKDLNMSLNEYLNDSDIIDKSILIFTINAIVCDWFYGSMEYKKYFDIRKYNQLFYMGFLLLSMFQDHFRIVSFAGFCFIPEWIISMDCIFPGTYVTFDFTIYLYVFHVLYPVLLLFVNLNLKTPQIYSVIAFLTAFTEFIKITRWTYELKLLKQKEKDIQNMEDLKNMELLEKKKELKQE